MRSLPRCTKPRKKLPTIELALTLYCSFPYEKIVQETSFLVDSPLLNCQLLSLGLTGRKHLLASLKDSAQWLSRGAEAYETECPPAIVSRLVAQLSVQAPRPVMMLRGALGCGRAMAITMAVKNLQRDTLQLDVTRLPSKDTDAQHLLVQVLREVRMHAACLVVHSLESLTEER